MNDATAVRLTNDVSELPRLARWIQDFCEGHDLPPALAFSFDLALEEAVTNVIRGRPRRPTSRRRWKTGRPAGWGRS